MLYKIARVVIGENESFVGGEDYLKQRGIEVVVLQHEECKTLMQKFMNEKPNLWYNVFSRIHVHKSGANVSEGMKTLGSEERLPRLPISAFSDAYVYPHWQPSRLDEATRMFPFFLE